MNIRYIPLWSYMFEKIMFADTFCTQQFLNNGLPLLQLQQFALSLPEIEIWSVCVSFGTHATCSTMFLTSQFRNELETIVLRNECAVEVKTIYSTFGAFAAHCTNTQQFYTEQFCTQQFHTQQFHTQQFALNIICT